MGLSTQKSFEKPRYERTENGPGYSDPKFRDKPCGLCGKPSWSMQDMNPQKPLFVEVETATKKAA